MHNFASPFSRTAQPNFRFLNWLPRQREGDVRISEVYAKAASTRICIPRRCRQHFCSSPVLSVQIAIATTMTNQNAFVHSRFRSTRIIFIQTRLPNDKIVSDVGNAIDDAMCQNSHNVTVIGEGSQKHATDDAPLQLNTQFGIARQIEIYFESERRPDKASVVCGSFHEAKPKHTSLS